MKYNLKEEEKILLSNFIHKEIIDYIMKQEDTITRIKIDKDLIQSLLQTLIYYHTDILRYINLEGVSFSNIDIRYRNLSCTNAEIDPQEIWGKSLEKTNLSGLNLKGKSFKGVLIRGANLSDTKATININEVYNKDIKDANLTGCKMIDIKEEQKLNLETDYIKAKKYIKGLFR